MNQVLLALQSQGPPPVAPWEARPVLSRLSPAVPAFSESSCGLRWEISHYPSSAEGSRGGRPPLWSWKGLGMPPPSLHPLMAPRDLWGLCSLEGEQLGLGRESGRIAVSQPLLYFKM